MMADSGKIQLDKGPSGGRYFYAFPDGTEAEMVYIERSGVATITHTETPPHHRGDGTAAALVSRAVQDFRAAGLKVVPACSYARLQFQRHRDWADLLADR